jgi:hypothetical protein
MFGRDKKPQVDYKRQRMVANQKNRFKAVTERLSFLLRYVAGFVAIVLGIGLIILINNDNLFAVKEVSVNGTYRIDKTKVDQVVGEYVGKNILKISKNDVESKVKSNFSEVRNVYISKELNGKLNIEIVESSPVVVLINVNGITLLNNRALAVGTMEYPKFTYTETELKLANDQISLDDKIIQERFEKSQEGIELKILWKDASQEAKKAMLEELKNEVKNKVNLYFNEAKNKLKTSQFADLTFISDTSPNADTSSFLTEESIIFALKISESLTKISIGIDNIGYLKGDTFSIATVHGKTLLFYPRRDVADQLRDLNILILNGIYNNRSVIDLRGEKISVQ